MNKILVCDSCAADAGYIVGNIPTHQIEVKKCKQHCKRRRLNDDFESIYLRFNTLRRYIRRATPEITGTPDFQRVIKFKTEAYWKWGEKILHPSGFESEDLMSVVTAWSMAFAGMRAGEQPSRRLYNDMMKFLDQRFEYMSKGVWRKFNISERPGTVSIDCFDNPEAFAADGISKANPMAYLPFLSQEEYCERILPIQGLPRNPMIVQQTYELRNCDASGNMRRKQEIIKEQLRELKLRLKEIKDHDSPEVAREANSLQRRVKRLRQQGGEVKALITKETKESAEQVSKMRGILHADPKRFSTQLCYYASTKHVSYDVRQEARKVCDRYGIDYVGWATKQVNESRMRPGDLDVRVVRE